jgi:hypothetical protein
MTGRRMGSCAGGGKGGSFIRRGGGLGLLGLATWLLRAWTSGRQTAVVSSGAKESKAEGEDLKKHIEMLKKEIAAAEEQLKKLEKAK